MPISISGVNRKPGMVHSCKLQSAVAAQASSRLSAERLQRAVQLGQRESCGGASTVITYGSYDVHTDRSAALYGRSGPYGSRMNYHVTVTARMSRMYVVSLPFE